MTTPSPPTTWSAVRCYSPRSTSCTARHTATPAPPPLAPGRALRAPLDFVHRQQYLHARQTLTRLLELGVVPVVNENDAVADDEIRFGDNHRLAALVAPLVHADLPGLPTAPAGLPPAHPP